MAGPAVGQDVIRVIGIAAVLQALYVMRFQSAAPAAFPAFVGVTLKCDPARCSPAPGIQSGMMIAHSKVRL